MYKPYPDGHTKHVFETCLVQVMPDEMLDLVLKTCHSDSYEKLDLVVKVKTQVPSLFLLCTVPDEMTIWSYLD